MPSQYPRYCSRYCELLNCSPQVYLLQHEKKIHKKRTSTKKGERSPIFNEAMIFSVPAHSLQVSSFNLAGRLTLVLPID